jgi:hypothetical protein
MFYRKPLRQFIGLLSLGVAIQCANADPVMAGVMSATPTLPLLQPYGTATGLGCISTLGICFTSDSLTLTSVVSAKFVTAGQDIVTNAIYSGQLTTTGGKSMGPFSLTGTLEQQVTGRTFSTELGSWTTDITAVALSGPLLGNTLTVGLDPKQLSTGTTSIVAAGAEFDISSFFDLHFELRTDGTPPLNTSVGPVRFDVTSQPASGSMPEPASLLLLATPLLALAALKRRYTDIRASRIARMSSIVPHS